MKKILIAVGGLCILGINSCLRASSNDAALRPGDTRYGLFNSLDHRSEYGEGVFPEPFLVDDSDLEPGEARLDWLHTRTSGSTRDAGKFEIEKGFGVVTFELEVPYERDRQDGETAKGFDNIDLGARTPFFQYVSAKELVDTTFGAAIELGIPTQSALSKNPELVPKVFNDTKVGNFTVQSIVGYSALFGPGDQGGLHTFEYGFVFGYTIRHAQLPIPLVLETIPFLELIGETELNKDDPGHNALLGNAGFRFNLKAIGRLQPRPGIGVVFPIDRGGRDEAHWGVITSLVVQF